MAELGDRHVGFIGLGAMGLPMALNLVRAGLAVRGYDIAEAARDRLAHGGGQAVTTPAEAAADVGLLILVVATAAQAEAVLFGEGGAAGVLPKGATVVLHSTVPPVFARQLGERLAADGHPLLDAPISGGRVGAEAASLTVMASGSAAAFEAADRALAAVAGKVYRLGEAPGIGSTVKMINQHLAGVHIAAASEAMALGVRAGADARTLFDVISHSAGNSWMFTNRVPHILSRDFTPLSAVEIFVKDLGIVLDTGHELRFPLPIAAAAHQQYLAAAAAGHGREDDSAVVKVYEELARIEVKGGSKS
jgi:3-hydroxyisobutyrate dehydrogenase